MYIPYQSHSSLGKYKHSCLLMTPEEESHSSLVCQKLLLRFHVHTASQSQSEVYSILHLPYGLTYLIPIQVVWGNYLPIAIVSCIR